MIGWLYQKIFITIIPYGEKYEVGVAYYKKKKRLSRETRRYEGVLAIEEMARYVRRIVEESPLHYVALLNPDPNQGALEGCTIHEINDSEEMSGTKTICRNQKWMLYASARELELLKKKYATIGLDFVFSPFSVIERFFADKTGGKLGLYVLAQKEAMSIAFFEDGKLEYAHHYPLHAEEGSIGIDEGSGIGFSVGVEEEEPSRGINLDQIESLDDLEIIDELDDLSDIEDLDTLEEIAEFSEEEPIFEEKLPSLMQSGDGKEEGERFSDDFYRFELIEKTLARFYAGEHCRNRFVETVWIADAYGNGNELKRYLEEELFLNVMVRKIDLGEEVLSLALEEESQ
ncbi:hypothetical protein E0765_09310 [Sulfuricurvum sp. IAE1]|uniref:hypothetical protein n=1 Tax=Sulfuricurvum sp. IAE1 TaxID=2546102 RepID=UPI001051B34F|nr:hypothetical protein [Sulfuricurvum sp. IAE1]MDD3769551.1 hypothetical protein [Sulfuricurvum sp.]MDX9965397.1 hypothetical protein [Sulfuricurvum sp.]TDA62777.1 hypothetical protein E0765_09310 [Sulfuricurvum sp. IAE1]